ncbi:tRNA lysidine(34) synthetase TilS [Clostridium sp. LBM24168]
MLETVLDTIKKNNMFDKKDKVIVAVSGGPDSLCLLHILYTLREKLGILLCVVHLNHGLRGKEADEDEEFVREFCKKINVGFRSKKVNINKIAREYNISSESAGRKVRYEFFDEVKKEIGAHKIAIAHNANDQAETVLMRIMRGSGLEGLTGIKAVRSDTFVRPLINNTRYEIEQYCRENKLNPRIDKTNFQTIYSRNKVRLELIPYIEKNFNRNIIRTLNRLSDIIKVDSDYLNRISQEKFKKYCDITSEKVIISKEAFLEDESIISRILRLALQKVSGYLHNFERIHIMDIIRIQNHPTGKQLMLPNSIVVLNNYGSIIIKKNIEKYAQHINNYILHEGINNISEYNCKVYINTYYGKYNRYKGKDRYIEYFDLDKVKGDIVLRNRKEGDRFRPLGMDGSKKLKNMFIDLKIAKDKRENIPLICFGKDIGWVVGYRISDLFKVDESTRNILAISFESEEL